jgi:hypothetical protein
VTLSKVAVLDLCDEYKLQLGVSGGGRDLLVENLEMCRRERADANLSIPKVRQLAAEFLRRTIQHQIGATLS